MRLIFLRHGQSASNAAVGAVDLPGDSGDRLTELGHRQAREAAAALRGCGATRLVASGMRRAQETAGPIAAELGLELETDEGIHELRQSADFGARAARAAEALALVGVDDRPRRRPGLRAAGAESFNVVRERVRAFKSRLEQGDPDQVVLAVSHGIFQRFFLFDSILGDGFGPRHRPPPVADPHRQLRRLGLRARPVRDPLDPPVEGWLCLSWMSRWWDQP